MSGDAFHLTPHDVRKQEFRRSLRGYEPLGVEDFRVRVADELERILRERSVLEERLAALGLSEETDATVLVVSEETSTISVASHGLLHRHLTAPQVRDLLSGAISHLEGGERVTAPAS